MVRLFNRMADRAERVVSHPVFFSCCVLLIVLWAPLIVFLNVDTWQLIVNTLTTIITFLLLALLTNTQRRFEQRTDDCLRRIKDRADLLYVFILRAEERAKLAEINEEVRHATRTEAPGGQSAP